MKSLRILEDLEMRVWKANANCVCIIFFHLSTCKTVFSHAFAKSSSITLHTCALRRHLAIFNNECSLIYNSLMFMFNLMTSHVCFFAWKPLTLSHPLAGCGRKLQEEWDWWIGLFSHSSHHPMVMCHCLALILDQLWFYWLSLFLYFYCILSQPKGRTVNYSINFTLTQPWHFVVSMCCHIDSAAPVNNEVVC